MTVDYQGLYKEALDHLDVVTLRIAEVVQALAEGDSGKLKSLMHRLDLEAACARQDCFDQDDDMTYYVELTYRNQHTGETTVETKCVRDLQEGFDHIAEHFGNTIPPEQARIKTL